jgi:type 1 glutamine amidotransferase
MTLRSLRFAGSFLFALMVAPLAHGQDKEPLWVVYDGFDGPGKGKHIVLISGDEEYRSEEALPQLGKILAKHHGFKCTVLFAIDPKTGEINPSVNNNIPGLEQLKTADLMIIATRFRNLPEEQMQHVADYIESGKPIIGMRTATHAFSGMKGKFAKYNNGNNSKDYEGGFGRQILGERWVSHHGGHNSQSTRGILPKGAEKHPILKGIKDGDIWGPTDVYGVRLPLPAGCEPLVMGQVLVGMKSTDKALEGKKNDPMMPVAWTRTLNSASRKPTRIFTTTMGASEDLAADGTRRMLVNASYWCVGLEDRIANLSNVEIVGEYQPRHFAGGGYKKGVRPSQLSMK